MTLLSIHSLIVILSISSLYFIPTFSFIFLQRIINSNVDHNIKTIIGNKSDNRFYIIRYIYIINLFLHEMSHAIVGAIFQLKIKKIHFISFNVKDPDTYGDVSLQAQETTSPFMRQLNYLGFYFSGIAPIYILGIITYMICNYLFSFNQINLKLNITDIGVINTNLIVCKGVSELLKTIFFNNSGNILVLLLILFFLNQGFNLSDDDLKMSAYGFVNFLIMLGLIIFVSLLISNSVLLITIFIKYAIYVYTIGLIVLCSEIVWNIILIIIIKFLSIFNKKKQVKNA